MTFPTAMTIMNKETSLMITLEIFTETLLMRAVIKVEVSLTTVTGEAIVVG